MMSPPSQQRVQIPRAFWYALVALHGVYAYVLSQQYGFLRDPGLDRFDMRFAEIAVLADLVLLPALVFAYLARKQPRQALLGSLGMLSLGLLAIRIWYPESEYGPVLTGLMELRNIVWPLLIAVAIALELYVLWKILQQLRSPMKEGYIELMLAPFIQSLGAEHWTVRWFAAEQRLWIYSLSRKLPSAEDFAGQVHFGYAKQNSNASNWLGFCIVNIAPTPVLHLILHFINPMLAWITTLLSILTSVWMWAEYRATQCRPISLDLVDGKPILRLRYGIFTDRVLALESLQLVRVLSWQDLESKAMRSMKIKRYCGMGDANVELKFEAETLWLGVDQPEQLRSALMGYAVNNQSEEQSLETAQRLPN
jgi:hypothetical protein